MSKKKRTGKKNRYFGTSKPADNQNANLPKLFHILLVFRHAMKSGNILIGHLIQYFTDDATGDKKRQKRGGRGNIKSKPKKEPDFVKLARIPRGKRKYVTRVTGLATFGRKFCFVVSK